MKEVELRGVGSTKEGFEGEGAGDCGKMSSSSRDLRHPLNASSPVSPPVSRGAASVFSCVCNLANTILGSGMLGLPGAFAGAGSLTGTVLLLAAAAFSSNGLRLLSLSAAKVGYREPTSFYAVANAAYPSFTSIIDITVALKCFGVATSYLIIVGDTMVDTMKYFCGKDSTLIWVERHLWVMIGTACVASLR